MAYWLFKSEPNTWGWQDQLDRKGRPALTVELVLPAPSIGFGFEKPISHFHASLRIGVRKTADQMIPAANFHRFKQTGFMIGVIIDKSLRASFCR